MFNNVDDLLKFYEQMLKKYKGDLENMEFTDLYYNSTYTTINVYNSVLKDLKELKESELIHGVK